MKLKYDQEADALYIYLNESKIDHTQEIDDNTILDFDKNNQVIGIEMLFVKERNPELLKKFKQEHLISA